MSPKARATLFDEVTSIQTAPARQGAIPMSAFTTKGPLSDNCFDAATAPATRAAFPD